jgi:hypothetical protein
MRTNSTKSSIFSGWLCDRRLVLECCGHQHGENYELLLVPLTVHGTAIRVQLIGIVVQLTTFSVQYISCSTNFLTSSIESAS